MYRPTVIDSSLMEFPVTLFLDPQNPLCVSLCFSDDPVVHFSFADADGSPIAEDPITSFASVEFRAEPPRHVVFSGPSVSRSLVFETDEDYRRFFEGLGAQVTMSPQESNPSVMLLVHDAPKHSKMPWLWRYLLSYSGGGAAAPPRPTDGLVSRAIDVSVPRQPAAFTIEAARREDLALVNWAVLRVADDAWPDVFRLLLNAEPSGDYGDLCQQWRLTTVDQWKRHFLLRKFVHGLDTWLSHSQLPSQSHKQAFFNVVMGLFTDNFGALALGDGVLFICELMFKLFVRNETEDGAFALATGEVLPRIEAEAFLFAHMKPIIEQTRELPNARREAAATFTYLAELSPSTADMLEERGLKSLEFCRNHCDVFFSRGRSQSEPLILLAWALGGGNLAAFRKEMTSIALVLAQDKLQRIPLANTEEFSACFASELMSIPARLLVWNSWKLRNKCRIK